MSSEYGYFCGLFICVMIQKLEFLYGYCKHAISAQSKYSLHSPFAYHFYHDIIKNGEYDPHYKTVERVRNDLIVFSRFIKRRDLGAKAKDEPCDQRFVRVKDIARKSSVSAEKGQLLYRLVRDLHPENILELGTAFGISTLYLAFAAPHSRIITIEGCLDTAHLAQENFDKVGMKNITILNGSFEEKLPLALMELHSPDLVFVDGNHKKEATLHYFEDCLQHIHPESVFVFDDIHWSSGMNSAWKQIKAHPRVRVTFDLFYLGIVFFKEELSKEDFIIKF